MLKIFKNLKKTDVLYILICTSLIVFQVWLDLTMPDYTAKLTAAISMGELSMNEIWKNGGMMLLCAFGSMASAIACGYFSSHIAANFAKTLRSKLFDRITSFSAAEINRFSTPSLITRTTNDVVQMQMLIAMGMQVLIKAPILAVWAICKISLTSIEWTTATFIVVLIIAVTVGIIVGVCYPRFKKMQRLTDDLNTATRENLSGVRVIRAFNAENYQENKFDKVNREITRTNLFTSRTMGLMMPVISACMNGLTLAIYWIGAVLINEAQIMERATIIGNMTAFIQYALQVVMAFMMLIMIFILMPRAMVSAKRINEVLETEPSITYNSKSVKTDKTGEIEFKNVSFSYADNGASCIEDISFKVNRGETFAIIGATGTGKTTLINLIPRFYDATGGEVLIDGKNIKEYSKDDLERKISIAPQRAVLFKGDIKTNVTYGAKEAVSDDSPRLIQALKCAHADFVFDADDGIHSQVAQGGTNFSGGQKQRLSIARALFKDAEIVIFDDTFSALDYKTDMLVRRSIRENFAGATVILVAQRIGTIKNADKILVLDNGRIAGLGKHDELMQTCDVYKEIALSQLSKEEL
ncbi:MAG: ABC transporter ATP-binding protein [Acutalibacteraceae bacterium]